MRSTVVLLSSSLASHTSSSRPLLSILLAFCFHCSLAQSTPDNRPDTTNYTTRRWIIAGTHAVGYGGSLLLLNNTWYKGYERTSLHSFDDRKEWNQMDKLGHTWGAYNMSKVSTAMWEWAGLSHKKAVIAAGAGSLAYLTAIEFLDGRSAKWGWSWSDIGANIAGTGIFAAQELAWQEQKFQFKFSFHGNAYNDPQLDQRADELFGKPWYERMLKDYNAQTYWLSANIHGLLPQSALPPWLNIAVGYGAEGMYGGFENKWTDKLGTVIDRTDIPRKRQFYLAPDVDFTRIPTKKKWLKTAFTFLNAFKCPAPALMLDSKGKFRAYAIYF